MSGPVKLSCGRGDNRELICCINVCLDRLDLPGVPVDCTTVLALLCLCAVPLIYSFVARGNTVLADYTSFTGNFSVVAIRELELLGHCAKRLTGLGALRRRTPVCRR